MKALLDDGLAALADLLQSGAGSCPPETEERLRQLSQAWEDTGLHTGAALLEDVANALSDRRHGGARQPVALMGLVGRAVRYTRLCREKYVLDQAGARLCQSEYKEETTDETTA